MDSVIVLSAGDAECQQRFEELILKQLRSRSGIDCPTSVGPTAHISDGDFFDWFDEHEKSLKG